MAYRRSVLLAILSSMVAGCSGLLEQTSNETPTETPSSTSQPETPVNDESQEAIVGTNTIVSESTIVINE